MCTQDTESAADGQIEMPDGETPVDRTAAPQPTSLESILVAFAMSCSLALEVVPGR
jgi:hypothetical protein